MNDSHAPAQRLAASAPDSKRLTVDLPRELHRRLKIRAAAKEMTMAEVLREMLATWLEREDA